MSRIAKLPVSIPQGVEVAVQGEEVAVKGGLGSLRMALLTGTMRQLVNNMIVGVSKGFEKKLSLVGVGYRAQAQGAALNLSVGFSHPVVIQMPEGVKVETPSQTEVVIKGSDRQQVGQTAAKVRGIRPPEPYKGKGIRYADERVVLKETKKK